MSSRNSKMLASVSCGDFLRRVGVLLSSSPPSADFVDGGQVPRSGAIPELGEKARPWSSLCSVSVSLPLLGVPSFASSAARSNTGVSHTGRIQIVEFIAAMANSKVSPVSSPASLLSPTGYCSHILMLSLGLCFWPSARAALMGTVPRCSFARPPVRGVRPRVTPRRP